MTGVISSVLKTAEVVPIFRKDSKKAYKTIAQSACYQIVRQYLKVCIKDCTPLTFINRLLNLKNN